MDEYMDELDFLGQKVKCTIKAAFFEKDCLIKIDTEDDKHYREIIRDIYQLRDPKGCIELSIMKGLEKIMEMQEVKYE